MVLADLETFDQFILGLIGDFELSQQKPRRILGPNSRTANYLTSLKLLEYCGSGEYRLTALGWEFYYERELRFIEMSKNKSILVNETKITI